MWWYTGFAIIAIPLAAGCLWLVGERGRLILPATRRTFRSQGLRRALRLQTWHLYVYGCWPRVYIGALIHGLFRFLAVSPVPGRHFLSNHYHGKVLTPEHARSLVTVEKPIRLRDLEQVIPYPVARLLLLDTPLDMAVYECPCRLTRAVPCQPTQVCMIMGQPFVDLLLEHHPRTSRRLARDEALELLAAEHRRGHVHVAWFKDACFDRFFAICNCCRCCCGGIDAMLHHGIPMIASSGFVAAVAADRCRGCGACAAVCPFGAVSVNGQATVDGLRCMGCGVCVDQCRSDAIRLVRDETRGVPLDVQLLELSPPRA
jgi:ferredoxin